MKLRDWILGRRRRVVILAMVSLMALILALFVANGLSESWRQPRVGVSHLVPDRAKKSELKILAFNIAKCFAYAGVTKFAPESDVYRRLERIATLIDDENPDVVFLSEVVNECGPRPIDQVSYLAQRCKFSCWASSDNYSWGLPFFRIRSGNAVLSRLPLSNFKTMALANNDSSLFNPTNNRRALWCDIELNGKKILAGSLRNDSFDLENNNRQVGQILKFIGDRPTILAGDFNAEPKDESMKRFQACGKFSASWRGPPTYPTPKPSRRIDFILAPKAWTLKLERVLGTDVSDHLPLVATFTLP